MPEDSEVIKGLLEFLEKVVTDINTYEDKIEKELVDNLKKTADILRKLLAATPVDKSAVEDVV
jgi:hypothetical protein